MSRRFPLLLLLAPLAVAVSGCSIGTPDPAWRMDPDGTNQARMTATTFSESAPSFSPDARKVAYVSQRAANSTDIFVANVDGTDEQRLTTTGNNSEPIWSPDGRKIAFLSNRTGDFEIYVMNADGSDQVNITNAPGVDQHADWSPDGKRLVFIHQLHLKTMAADGSDVRDLERSGSDPAWSPDGRTIAFAQGTNNLINFIPAEGGTVTATAPSARARESRSSPGRRTARSSRSTTTSSPRAPRSTSSTGTAPA
jgi:Tol biopolymer transport system component